MLRVVSGTSAYKYRILHGLFLLFVFDSATAWDGKAGAMPTDDYRGPCPATIEIEAYFWSPTESEVQFSWVTSGDASSKGQSKRQSVAVNNEEDGSYNVIAKHTWEIEESGDYWAGILVDGTKRVRRSTFSVECSSQESATDYSEPSESKAGESDNEAAGTGDVIVFGDLESTDVSSEAGGDESGATTIEVGKIGVPVPIALKTVTFTCLNEIELGSVWESEEGWQPSWEKFVAPFAVQIINDGQLVCMYQKSPLTVPLKQPIPWYAEDCRKKGRGFVCTDKRT
jgi:hypothetical protein